MAQGPALLPRGEREADLDLLEQTPLEERVALDLASWDRHVARCTECLAQGLELCYEGRYLQHVVARSMSALDRARVRAERAISSGVVDLARPVDG